MTDKELDIFNGNIFKFAGDDYEIAQNQDRNDVIIIHKKEAIFLHTSSIIKYLT